MKKKAMPMKGKMPMKAAAPMPKGKVGGKMAMPFGKKGK